MPLSTNDSPSSMSLKPYLELRHYISLTWLAYPILSLLFIAFRLQLSLDSANENIASAKENLIASCKAAERAATSAASMPRFLALATNEGFADTVNGSLNAARAALILSLTVMEAIINFIIDIYRSTFLCFLELVIRGGLAVIIGAVKEVGDLITNIANGLGTSLQNDIQKANGIIGDAINAINKVNPFGDIKPPQIPTPDLSALTGFKFPTTLEDSLSKANSTIPTFNDIKDKIEKIVNTPFELLKKDINETFAGISFDRSVLPVPQQNNVVFCQDLDTSIVDDVGRELVKIAKIGVIIIIVLALLLVALNCLLEWYKWRCQQTHAEYIRQAWTTDRTVTYTVTSNGTPSVALTNHNILMLHATTSHPLIERIMNQMSNALRLSPAAQTRLSWYLHYIFHTPALACFLIGFFGLISVQLQLWALSPLTAKFAEREAGAVADFSNTIFTSVNESMYDQSSAYANDVNGRIDTMQNTLNQGVFGWVNGTTTTINSTINEVYDDIQNAVNQVFGGTILEQPAQEFIRCLIGTKVDAIEKALTFLHDNLKVDVPRMNQTALVLSEGSINEATRPIALAAVGDGSTSESGGIVGRLVDAYAKSLRKERIMFAIFLGLWLFVCLMGLVWLIWEAKRGKKTPVTDTSITPFTGGYPKSADEFSEKGYGAGLEAVDSRSSSPVEQKKNFALPIFSLFNKPSAATPANNEPALERTRTISEPMKLRAFGGGFSKGKKEPGLVLEEDGYEPEFKPVSEPVAEQLQQETRQPSTVERTKSGWFRRILKKTPAEEHDRTSSVISLHPSYPHNNVQDPFNSRSRWSVSPPVSPRSPGQPSSPSPFSPTDNTVTTPWVAVTSPSTSSLQSQQAKAQATLNGGLAPPLHHGYGYPSASPSSYYPSPYPSTLPSASATLPEPSPVSRLLSSNPARRSSASGVNPFSTPFDDEHRVKIQPGVQRKSIPTNPFMISS